MKKIISIIALLIISVSAFAGHWYYADFAKDSHYEAYRAYLYEDDCGASFVYWNDCKDFRIFAPKNVKFDSFHEMACGYVELLGENNTVHEKISLDIPVAVDSTCCYFNPDIDGIHEDLNKIVEWIGGGNGELHIVIETKNESFVELHISVANPSE